MKLLQGNRVSTEGRLSQQAYVLSFTLPFIVTLALTASMLMAPELFATFGQVGIIGAALGWLLLMVLGDALNIRRYHDLGYSGRLYRLARPGIVVLPLLAFALDFLIPAQMASFGDTQMQLLMISEALSPSMHPVTLTLLGLTVAGVTGNVLFLSLMPGQPGSNEHGPNPNSGAGSLPGAKAPAAGQAVTGDDPVKRALADYHTQLAASAARQSPTATAPAAFGKKRR